ncbi:MAG TPA: glucosidase [Phycisphaerae bacterium]|nr:glucosidase [Phycisphaerae bacterium]
MARKTAGDIEVRRLAEDARRDKDWKRWGPYLAERQWGTTREDYSAAGNPWRYFTHEHARSRAYRWGEDGLLGFTDRQCRLCFALALWNGRDPILKERLFGLTNPEGNHGEDVKECYFYLDATPTYTYAKALYKYPQAEFPYEQLVAENGRRNRYEREFELQDTGIFDERRYFDVLAEYAKNSPNDVRIRISLSNRGPERAALHVLPTLWFRNTWSWGCGFEGCWPKPRIALTGPSELTCDHETLGRFHLRVGPAPNGEGPRFLFTDNETNTQRLYRVPNENPYVKDAFHQYVIHNQTGAVNPQQTGTKAAAYYVLEIPPDSTVVLRLRLFDEEERPAQPFGPQFERIFTQRVKEADAYYAEVIPKKASEDEQRISRQAYAGLLWSKQFYHYVVHNWLEGDPLQPPPPPRVHGRNRNWTHMFNRDVVSVPDKWEFPYYASWDLAFHMLPLAQLDPHFAKQQLILFLREWYMHPSGALPAYEFNLDDANPPVHAWACWRVYKITGQRGQRDRSFLERVFHKLLINFTWWVNRKDRTGKHVFSGGYLGLDNIGPIDRSMPLPGGGHLQQADATAWMAFYCLTMLAIAMELAVEDPAYEDVASKFFEHFVAIADAINTLNGTGLWDEQDGFYYDHARVNGRSSRLPFRSMVGLIPLLAVEVLDDEAVNRLPSFRKRMQWFLDNRRDLAGRISCFTSRKVEGRSGRLLALPARPRLERVLRYMLDENEFLSPYGIRSLSRVHAGEPCMCLSGGDEFPVEYQPGEDTTGLFGGNSNWRGPVWFPVNYLLIEALERYHRYYGDDLLVEFPTGSGRTMNLKQVARELSERLVRIFRADEQGRRVLHGSDYRFADDPHWRDLLLFHEYFHGENGRGLGASHQTGWTALVTRLLEDQYKAPPAAPKRVRKPRAAKTAEPVATPSAGRPAKRGKAGASRTSRSKRKA